MRQSVSSAKSLMLRVFSAMGGFDLARFLLCRRVAIVFYHRFSRRDEPFKLRRDHFERQIRFFKEKYSPVGLDQYLEAMQGRARLPRNPLIVTIDDGYRDNYEVAFPVLRSHGVPATIFLSTDFVDKRAWLWANKLEYILKNTRFDRFSYVLNGNPRQFRVDSFEHWHASQLAIFDFLRQLGDRERNEALQDLAGHLKVEVPAQARGDFAPLTWQDIRVMHEWGIDFGSHSATHAILSRSTPVDLQREVAESKRTIEHALQAPVRSFCYPNGRPEDYSEAVVRAVAEAGYGCAVTTVSGLNRARPVNPFELKRIPLPPSDPHRMAKRLVCPK